MKIWMHGIFGAILAGSLWTCFWQIIVTMVLVISTGAAISIQTGPSVLAGATLGLIAILLRAKRCVSHHFLGCTTMAAFIWAFSFATPFDPGGLLPDWQSWFSLLIVAVLSWLCFTSVLKNISPTMQNRYVSEQFYLRLFWGLGLVIFILIVIAPFYVMVMTSLKSQQSLLANPLDLSINMDAGVTVLFRSYIELFTEYDFGLLLMNSSLVSVSTVLITLLFSIPGAYAVARLQFPGRNLLSGSVLLIYLIPAIVLVIPLYAVFSQLGLRNSLIGLCIVYPATTIPVALYMFRGYFAGLPSELDDAGLMDGLTRWQIIFKIAVPLSKPAIASVALYVFMIAWNEFLFAFMFLDDIKLFTLSRGIVSLNSSEVPREHLMAGAVIATIPVLLLFLWFEKFLVSGLTSGSVKG